MDLLLFGLLLVLTAVSSSSPDHAHQQGGGAHSTSDSGRVDSGLARLVRERGYRGGTLAAMKDGRLLYATATGTDHHGNALHPHSLFPVSSVSKSLTALAVLRLAQAGRLGLNDRVFGEGGLLSFIQPRPHSPPPDPRLQDITVDHLLRHSAGWDAGQPPLLEPLFNQLYLKRGHQVPDVAKELGVGGAEGQEEGEELSSLDLISYVIRQPLSFTPGTRVVYSNFGYAVLGRVVEAVSDMDYPGFVKKEILEPCGMWHTRLGHPAGHHKDVVVVEDPVEGEKLEDRDAAAGSSKEDQEAGEEASVYEVLPPSLLDSSLGWYSNVYDLMRLVKCMDSGLVSARWLEDVRRRPPAAPVQHSESWHGAGFKVNTHGALWQVNDPHTDDLLLYHRFRDGDQPGHLPDAWVLLMAGRRAPHLRHEARALVGVLEPPRHPHNAFLDDLTDLPPPPQGVLAKLRVEEHHMPAYISALRQSQFDPVWLSAVWVEGRTVFSVLARPMAMDSEASWDYRVEFGLTERRLLALKLQQEKAGFNMTFLLNYYSESHADHEVYVAVFRRSGFPPGVELKFGLHHFTQPYDKLVHVYYEAGYHPTVQSCLHHLDEDYISFIFLRARVNGSKADFKNYHDVSTSRLQKIVETNAKAERRLIYLDVTEAQRRPQFSAIFARGLHGRWLFKTALRGEEALALITQQVRQGLVPTQLVLYSDKRDALHYALHMQEHFEHLPPLATSD